MTDAIQETLDRSNEAATKLSDLLDQAVNVARATIEAGEENMPTWLLQDAEGRLEIYFTPWSSNLDKALAGLFMCRQIKLNKAVRVVFVSETWMVETKGDKEIHCQPSQHPDRKEVLMINGEDKTGEQVYRHYEILRPQNKLGPAMNRDYAVSVGRFANMFTA